MITHNEPMALVLTKRGIKTIYSLGCVNLESGEYDRLALLAEARGYAIYLTSVVEIKSFPQLYNQIQSDVT